MFSFGKKRNGDSLDKKPGSANTSVENPNDKALDRANGPGLFGKLIAGLGKTGLTSVQVSEILFLVPRLSMSLYLMKSSPGCFQQMLELKRQITLLTV